MWCISFEIMSCCSCIGHIGVLFIFWGLINDIISIKRFNLSWILFIIISLACHPLGFHTKCFVLPPMVLVLIADSWKIYFVLVHVLLLWLWKNLFPWGHKYTLGSRITSYLLLLPSDLSCVLFPIVPVPCWNWIAMVVAWVINCAVWDLFYLVKVLLTAINCATTSMSEEAYIAKLSSIEEKSSCSSEVWLE